eukprot:jgi/Botrbrau1/15794/Bobra.4_1s0145.1
MPEGEVTVAPELTAILDDFLDKEAFSKIRELLGGEVPRRIVCTGLGLGGSVAIVAAVLAAIQYPSAEVRCITIDAPAFGTGGGSQTQNAFNTLYRYLVRFRYQATRGELESLTPGKKFAEPQYGQYNQADRTNFKGADLKPEMWSNAYLEKLLNSMSPIIEAPEEWGRGAREMGMDMGMGMYMGLEDMELRRDMDMETDMDKDMGMGTDKDKGMAMDKGMGMDMKSILEPFKGAFLQYPEGKPEVEWWQKLYSIPPAAGQVSLQWTDDVTPPFPKMDSLEKLFLSGKKVPALAALSAQAYTDDLAEFEKLTGLVGADFINRPGRPKGQNGKAYVAYRPKTNTLIVAFPR